MNLDEFLKKGKLSLESITDHHKTVRRQGLEPRQAQKKQVK